MNIGAIGPIVAIDIFGNGEQLDIILHLWHHGCHSIEMGDAIFRRSDQGGGVGRVSAVAMPGRHLLDMSTAVGGMFGSGWIGRLPGRSAPRSTARRAFSSSWSTSPRSYTRLVAGMVRFFEGGQARADLRGIVENVAAMETGNRSIERDGAWVDGPEIR